MAILPRKMSGSSDRRPSSMTLALLDVLKQPSHDVTHSTIDVEASICQHLHDLLNVRRGSVCYLFDYGLPDIVNLYDALPDALDDFLMAIERLIQEYEPRLQQVSLTGYHRKEGPCVLAIDITGQLVRGMPAVFETQFLRSGVADVTMR